MQYPVRPERMTYDDIDIQTARVKPVQQKVSSDCLVCRKQVEINTYLQ